MTSDSSEAPAGGEIQSSSSSSGAINDSLVADLKRFLLRDELTEEDATELARLTQQRVHPAGSVILAEGARNEFLFFLLDGSVAVLKRGERIASLHNPGDVLGEMSVITGQPTAASLVAETEVSLLAVEVSKLPTLSAKLQTQLSSVLNRFYSIILTQRLLATNEKARLFEITNRELQKTQKALEEASQDKIGELASNQQSIIKRINSIITGQMASVRDGIAGLAGTMKGGDALSAQQLSGQIDGIYHDLLPLLNATRSESATRNKRVVLVESDTNERINAKISIGGTGANLIVAANEEEGRKAIQAEKVDILCVCEDFSSLIAETKQLYPDAQCVFTTSKTIEEYLPVLRSQPGISTILAKHPQDRSFTIKSTSTTIRKLSSGDLFGLEKYLGWGTEIQERKIVGSRERDGLREELREYLASIDIRDMIIRKCTRVAEELLMNAIYDAPVDAEGKAIYNHLERVVPISLEPSQQGTFRYGCDGQYVAVSVEDPFGSLKRSVILNYLEKCFGQYTGEQISGKGGGGNGLYQIVQSSSLVVFNVKPGVRTEVIALFNLSAQFDKLRIHPSFHYFQG